MALIVLTSASGSPGVTTTALGLALTWPRPVLLVDADPTGGSSVFAGYLRGQVEPTGGLLDLALAHRRNELDQALPATVMPIPDSTVQLLPGTRAHGQARSLASLWEPLGLALRGLERNGQDVIVDAGRLGLVGSPEPLVYAADLALLVTRSTVPALAGANSWAVTLRSEFEQLGAPTRLAVLMIGTGNPFVAREVTKVLHLPVLGSLAWDDPTAQVFSVGATNENRLTGLSPLRQVRAGRRLEGSALVRSLRATEDSIATTLATNRATLEPTGPRP